MRVAIATPAPEWTTRVWSLDALGTRNVSAVAATSDGFLWVATRTSLLRFDGTTFVRYWGRHLNGGDELQFDHLAANATSLWAATDRGHVMQFSGDRVSRYSGLPKSKSDTLCLDRDGAAWIVYGGGKLWRLKDGSAERVGRTEGIGTGAIVLAADRAGNVWITQNRTLRIWHADHFESVATLPSDGRVVLAASAAGGVWVAVGRDLYHATPAGTLAPIAADLGPIQVPIDVMLDDGSGLWIATHLAGLYRLERGRTEVMSVPVSYRYIDALVTDQSGDVWVGTMGGGLNRLHRRVFSVEGGVSGVPADAIQSLCEDSTGTLWGVTQSSRVVIRRNDTWQPAPGLSVDGAICIAADPGGGVWIGTHNRRLYAWRNGALASFGAAEGLGCINVWALLPCANSDVWMTGSRSNAVYRLRGGRITRLPLSNPKLRPMQIAQDRAGTVWVGTLEGLLFRAVGDRLVEESESYPLVDHHVIRSLHATRDGALIVGYEGGGLGWLKDGRFAEFGADGSLGSRYVEDVAEDDAGWLWCGTERGIFAVPASQLSAGSQSPPAPVSSVLFGADDGLPDLTTTGVETTGALRTHDGRIWMPIGSALVIIDPANANLAPARPRLYLTRVVVDRQPLAEHFGVLSAALTAEPAKPLPAAGDAVTIPPGRNVEFDFSCPNLARPNAAILRYRLRGFDDAWTDAPATHAASFARLSSGRYRFEVEAIDPTTRSHAFAGLGVIVEPHFWETWWFKAVSLALFTSTVVAGVRTVSYRRLRRKMAELERQAELDRERTRIARDIHDDVGTALTRILLLSNLAQRETGRTAESAEHLTAISRSAEEVTGALDEIVWAVNPRNDTLSHLVDYLAKFAVEFLRAAGIECRLELPDRVPEEMVSADGRHSVLLVIKEALNNVVRHSGATVATLRVDLTADALTAMVHDNGRGFGGDPTKPGSDGLANMRERMKELGGRCDITSTAGDGTSVTLVWPRGQPGKARQF